MGHGEAGRRGRRGETVAAWWLRVHGWRILARNRRMPGGEVDLVAVRGTTLAVCEVKTRTGRLPAEVHPAQALRVHRVGETFLAAHPHLAAHQVRMDLVLVTGRWPLLRVRHLAGGLQDPHGAWRGPGDDPPGRFSPARPRTRTS